jgi:hypothetical protein
MEILYPEIQNFVDEAHQRALNNEIDQNIFEPEWEFLQNSEQKLIAIMNHEGEPEGPGEPQYGMVLYWIHEHLPIIDKLLTFNFPATSITL